MHNYTTCVDCRIEFPKFETHCTNCGTKRRKLDAGTLIMATGAMFIGYCLLSAIFRF